MTNYIALTIDDDARVFQLFAECPKHPKTDERLVGRVMEIDLMKWWYSCDRGCHHEPIPAERIAMVNAHVEYFRRRKETNADAGQSG